MCAPLDLPSPLEYGSTYYMRLNPTMRACACACACAHVIDVRARQKNRPYFVDCARIYMRTCMHAHEEKCSVSTAWQCVPVRRSRTASAMTWCVCAHAQGPKAAGQPRASGPSVRAGARRPPAYRPTYTARTDRPTLGAATEAQWQCSMRSGVRRHAAPTSPPARAGFGGKNGGFHISCV